MAMASVAGIFGLIIYLFVLMFPIALLVALQVWLCRKNVKLGLILPGIFLALSLLLTLSLAGFGALTIGGGTLTVRDEITGEIIQQENFESDVQINPAAFVGAGVSEQHPYGGVRRHLAALQGPPGHPGGFETDAD